MTRQPVTGSGSEATAPPLRVLTGSPSDEELAALVAVLAVRAAGAAGADARPATVPSRWADRDVLVRRPLAPAGPGAWQAALGRSSA